jgi:hypothetical protein
MGRDGCDGQASQQVGSRDGRAAATGRRHSRRAAATGGGHCSSTRMTKMAIDGSRRRVSAATDGGDGRAERTGVPTGHAAPRRQIGDRTPRWKKMDLGWIS